MCRKLAGIWVLFQWWSVLIGPEIKECCLSFPSHFLSPTGFGILCSPVGQYHHQQWQCYLTYWPFFISCWFYHFLTWFSRETDLSVLWTVANRLAKIRAHVSGSSIFASSTTLEINQKNSSWCRWNFHCHYFISQTANFSAATGQHFLRVSVGQENSLSPVYSGRVGFYTLLEIILDFVFCYIQILPLLCSLLKMSINENWEK